MKKKKCFYFFFWLHSNGLSNFRPSMRELLQHEFFAEDTGFKLELVNRDNLVDSSDSIVNFRLRITDQGKTRRAKPAHKENEAIEFEFNLCSDACGEITNNMVSLLVIDTFFEYFILQILSRP